MSNKSSSFGLRKFVSDAVRNDGIGVVRHREGFSIYGVRYITNFPVIGKIYHGKRKNKQNGF